MTAILKSTLLASVASSLLTPASTLAKEPGWFKEQRELALFVCLRKNYQALGIDIYGHDYSIFHDRYRRLTEKRSPDYDLKYFDFIKEKTGDFYKEQISVKAEGKSPPFTTIFAKCIEFSESKSLREFIIKNPL